MKGRREQGRGGGKIFTQSALALGSKCIHNGHMYSRHCANIQEEQRSGDKKEEEEGG